MPRGIVSAFRTQAHTSARKRFLNQRGGRVTVAEDLEMQEEEVDRMIDTGKEKGYLTYGEVNDLNPEGITSVFFIEEVMT